MDVGKLGDAVLDPSLEVLLRDSKGAKEPPKESPKGDGKQARKNLVREVQEFLVKPELIPYYAYLNNLYVYPESVCNYKIRIRLLMDHRSTLRRSKLNAEMLFAKYNSELMILYVLRSSAPFLTSLS